MDSKAQLTKTTVILHWLIAIAMIGSLAFGLYLEELPRSPDKGMLIGIHKSVGVLILAFALYRIVWRMINRFPDRLSSVPQWQEKVTKIVHLFLLAGTLFMPISGVMMSVGGGHPVAVFGFELIAAGAENELLGQIGHAIHGLGGKLLILAVALHLLASFKHALFTRDGTMKRILGSRV